MDLVERLAQRINLNAEAREEPAPPPAAPPHSVFERVPAEPFITRLDDVRSTFTRERASAELVELDLDDLAAKGFLTPDARHNLLAEEYRIIKRPLLRAAFSGARTENDRENIALVTSPRPGEGKTFSSINLAMSISSEPDYHVLLVDADVRQRGLTRALGMAHRKGLSEVLSTPEMSLADVIVRTNIPNLSVIPAGGGVKSPTEMFATARTRDLMAEMTERYSDRFIIVDSPPVLASSEPGVLAGYVGQVIMIAMAGETPKQAIADSLVLLDSTPRISFILNKVTLMAGSGRFGYYGYYGEN